MEKERCFFVVDVSFVRDCSYCCLLFVCDFPSVFVFCLWLVSNIKGRRVSLFESVFVQGQQVIHKSDFKCQVPGEGREGGGGGRCDSQTKHNKTPQTNHKDHHKEHHTKTHIKYHNNKRTKTITNTKQKTPQTKTTINNKTTQPRKHHKQKKVIFKMY